MEARRRSWLARSLRSPGFWAVAAVALLVGGYLLNALLEHAARLGPVTDQSPGWAYLTIFLLVFADGVCALFPAETTLNTASTLAVDGVLNLGGVMVAGALGAVGGDSALYWLARLSRRRLQSQVDRALQNERVATGMRLIGHGAPVLLCVGRYVPGLRFVVNATCGLSAYPYRASSCGQPSAERRGPSSPAPSPTSWRPLWRATPWPLSSCPASSAHSRSRWSSPSSCAASTAPTSPGPPRAAGKRLTHPGRGPTPVTGFLHVTGRPRRSDPPAFAADGRPSPIRTRVVPPGRGLSFGLIHPRASSFQ
jgi:uncharacterized membrane protein YdjX (TVP38/TMEM64 family)